MLTLIWEHLNLKEYDLVISSTGSWMCKGVKAKKTAIHISYIHHPPRYLYGYQTAIEWQKYWPIKMYGLLINHFLRMWDFTASQRPDYLIANSIETQRRIQKFYRRDSTVIYPPVTIPKMLAVTRYTLHDPYFITVSRLAKAKNVDLLIKAANEAKIQLKIVGIGRDMPYLKSLAGPTVTFLGNISDEELAKELSGAKAFLFASVDEEFGIAPVEAMGYGAPVIAFASGGLKETVKTGKNGYLFESLTVKDILSKIQLLEALSKEEYLQMRQNSRTEAEKYTEAIFQKNIQTFITSKSAHLLAQSEDCSRNYLESFFKEWEHI